jgi:hypothetical protein
MATRIGVSLASRHDVSDPRLDDAVPRVLVAAQREEIAGDECHREGAHDPTVAREIGHSALARAGPSSRWGMSVRAPPLR